MLLSPLRTIWQAKYSLLPSMNAAHQWQIFCHNAEQRQSKAKRKESGTIRVLCLLVINYFQPTLFYIRDEIKV